VAHFSTEAAPRQTGRVLRIQNRDAFGSCSAQQAPVSRN